MGLHALPFSLFKARRMPGTRPQGIACRAIDNDLYQLFPGHLWRAGAMHEEVEDGLVRFFLRSGPAARARSRRLDPASAGGMKQAANKALRLGQGALAAPGRTIKLAALRRLEWS